jgi:hypothetical protein
VGRFGLAVSGSPSLTEFASYPLERLPFGWYSNWNFEQQPARPAGAEYVQLIPVDQRYPPAWSAVVAAAQANPGALWLIGNEPECIYQGNRTPEEYAVIYHDCFVALKAADPACRVAIGGVVQPTPLRLEWLDRVLAAYQTRYGTPLVTDVWNIHNQVLRESRTRPGGCGIPAGLDADEGIDYPWWQNDNLDYFEAHVRAFRQWMAEHGQRDKPLIISEFGVLYPSSWFDALGGVSGDQRVCAYMVGAFDFLLGATDADTGYPADSNRLVQRWMWFSLNNPSWEQDPQDGFNGGLCDAYDHSITVFGECYEAYIRDLRASPASHLW